MQRTDMRLLKINLSYKACNVTCEDDTKLYSRLVDEVGHNSKLVYWHLPGALKRRYSHGMQQISRPARHRDIRTPSEYVKISLNSL